MESLERDMQSTLRVSNALFYVSLLALVLFLLTLPVFPTGDGPLHLYFSNIMWSLARHQPEYAHFYAIRHLIAPYSIHYFALIFFKTFLSPANAEKLFIVAIVLNTAFGFRFLAGKLGKNAAVAGLWMVPLLLTWSMGGGFLNFSLAIGLAYWAFGFWLMLPPAGSASALLGFVAMLVMLVLSHPVPLLVLVLFLASDLFLVWVEWLGAPGKTPHRRYGARFVAFGLSCVSMLAPAMIADKSQVSSIWPDVHFQMDVMRQFAMGACLGLFGGTHPLQLIYTGGLLVILPGAVFLLASGLWSRLRTRSMTPADRLLIISVVYLAATLYFPHSMNGSYFFPQRMWDLVWPLILACTAAAIVDPRTLHILAVTGAVLIVVAGIVCVQTLPAAAREQATLGAIALPEGSRGIYLAPAKVFNGYQLGFTYPIFYWSGARALVASHSILLNSPWLGLTVLPVKENGKAGLLADTLPNREVEDPSNLLTAVSTPSADRTMALDRSQFLLYADPVNQTPQLNKIAQTILQGQQGRWSCDTHTFYFVCLRKY